MVPEASQRYGGLWRRRARLMVCAMSWLTADSSQYSVLSFNLSTPITHTHSLSLSLYLSLFYLFYLFLILFESVSRVKSVNGFKKKEFRMGLGGLVRVRLEGLVNVGWA